MRREEKEVRKDSYPKVWSIIQAHNDPNVISSEEFETVLKNGLSGCSSGVMMFTSYSVAEDEGKTATMKDVYSELKIKRNGNNESYTK